MAVLEWERLAYDAAFLRTQRKLRDISQSLATCLTAELPLLSFNDLLFYLRGKKKRVKYNKKKGFINQSRKHLFNVAEMWSAYRKHKPATSSCSLSLAGQAPQSWSAGWCMLYFVCSLGFLLMESKVRRRMVPNQIFWRVVRMLPGCAFGAASCRSVSYSLDVPTIWCWIFLM